MHYFKPTFVEWVTFEQIIHTATSRIEIQCHNTPSSRQQEDKNAGNVEVCWGSKTSIAVKWHKQHADQHNLLTSHPQLDYFVMNLPELRQCCNHSAQLSRTSRRFTQTLKVASWHLEPVLNCWRHSDGLVSVPSITCLVSTAVGCDSTGSTGWSGREIPAYCRLYCLDLARAVCWDNAVRSDTILCAAGNVIMITAKCAR